MADAGVQGAVRDAGPAADVVTVLGSAPGVGARRRRRAARARRQRGDPGRERGDDHADVAAGVRAGRDRTRGDRGPERAAHGAAGRRPGVHAARAPGHADHDRAGGPVGRRGSSRACPPEHPAGSADPRLVEVGVSAAAADQLGLAVGQRLPLNGPTRGDVVAVVTGLYEPVDATSPVWSTVRRTSSTCSPRRPPPRSSGGAGLLVSDASLPDAMLAMQSSQSISTAFRFPVDPDRMRATDTGEIARAVSRIVAQPGPLTGSDGRTPSVDSALDTVLRAADARLLGGDGPDVGAARRPRGRGRPHARPRRAAAGGPARDVPARRACPRGVDRRRSRCARWRRACRSSPSPPPWAPPARGSLAPDARGTWLMAAAIVAGRRRRARDRRRGRGGRRVDRSPAARQPRRPRAGARPTPRAPPHRASSRSSRSPPPPWSRRGDAGSCRPRRAASTSCSRRHRCCWPAPRRSWSPGRSRPRCAPCPGSPPAGAGWCPWSRPPGRAAPAGTRVPLLTLTIAIALVVFCGTTAVTVTAGQRTAADIVVGAAGAASTGTLDADVVAALRDAPGVTGVAGATALSDRTFGRSSGVKAQVAAGGLRRPRRRSSPPTAARWTRAWPGSGRRPATASRRSSRRRCRARRTLIAPALMGAEAFVDLDVVGTADHPPVLPTQPRRPCRSAAGCRGRRPRRVRRRLGRRGASRPRPGSTDREPRRPSATPDWPTPPASRSPSATSG